MYPDGTKPSRESQTTVALNELDKQLAETHAISQILFERLNGVMRPDEPKAVAVDSRVPPRESLAPIADLIKGKTANLAGVTERPKAILDRLEI